MSFLRACQRKTTGRRVGGKNLEQEIVKLKKAIERRLSELEKIGAYDLDTIEGTIDFEGATFGVGVDASVTLRYTKPKA